MQDVAWATPLDHVEGIRHKIGWVQLLDGREIRGGDEQGAFGREFSIDIETLPVRGQSRRIESGVVAGKERGQKRGGCSERCAMAKERGWGAVEMNHQRDACSSHGSFNFERRRWVVAMPSRKSLVEYFPEFPAVIGVDGMMQILRVGAVKDLLDPVEYDWVVTGIEDSQTDGQQLIAQDSMSGIWVMGDLSAYLKDQLIRELSRGETGIDHVLNKERGCLIVEAGEIAHELHDGEEHLDTEGVELVGKVLTQEGLGDGFFGERNQAKRGHRGIGYLRVWTRRAQDGRILRG